MPARPLPDRDPDQDPDDESASDPQDETAQPHEATPEPTAEDVDAQWRDIVTRLGDLEAPPGERRRRAGDVRPGEQGPGARTVRPAGEPRAPEDVTAEPDAYRGWSPDPEVEEAEDHFQPPDPGPVLGGDPLLTMAWAVAIGVPLLLLAAVVVWQAVPALVLQVGGVAFVAAVGLLVWRMPHRDDEDRGPGAVV